jgi:transcriptional regulator with XRE-family HTH domain
VRRKPNSLQSLGERIRKLRKDKGLTQEELAHKSEIDRSYIGGVERGQRNLSFTKLCEIAEALECDVAELTRGIPERDQ